MNLRRGYSRIPSYEYLVGRKKFRKKITHLVGNFLVEIYIIDSSDVISMKCSHNLSF